MSIFEQKSSLVKLLVERRHEVRGQLSQQETILVVRLCSSNLMVAQVGPGGSGAASLGRSPPLLGITDI